MPKKGQYTAADAAKAGLVPAAPLRRLIDRWAAEHPWLDDWANDIDGERMVDAGSTTIIAEATGIHRDTIGKIRWGKKHWVEFGNADRIVGFIDPFLWHTDPELADIYQSFDFSHLDLGRPTSPEADPLLLVDELSDRAAAAALGVSTTVVQKRRQSRGFAGRRRVAA